MSDLKITPLGFDSGLKIVPLGFKTLGSPQPPPAGNPDFFFGSTQPTAVYYGNTAATAVYYGSTLIWEPPA